MILAEPAEVSKPSPEEVYQAFLRALRRRKGFGIVFVQCSPAQASRLIPRVLQDLPQKKTAVLNLSKSIDNFYEMIDERLDKNELNILFIQGIEKSLEPYIKPGYGGEGDYYNLDTVPRILSHLNQQRENFRDHFSGICFVFILPLFGIKYFIRRAPDFFDWSSGVFEFPTEAEQLDKESLHILLEKGSKRYWNLTYQERNQKLLKIEELVEEPNQNPELKAILLLEQGNLFISFNEFEAAIASYEKALKLKPDNYVAWRNRGYALDKLGRHQEAIFSYNKAIRIKPDFDAAWYDRGDALVELGRDREALASYEKVLFDEEFQTIFKWKNSNNVPIINFINHQLRQFNLRDMDVDDVLIEAYLKGYEVVKSGKILGNIPAWIRATVLNIIKEKISKKTVHEMEILEFESTLDFDNLPTINNLINKNVVSQLEVIQSALKNLESIDRNIIRLYFIEGLTLSEIAEQLNLSLASLSRRLYKAIARLRSIIHDRRLN